jgi:hypothetical protein
MSKAHIILPTDDIQTSQRTPIYCTQLFQKSQVGTSGSDDGYIHTWIEDLQVEEGRQVTKGLVLQNLDTVL